MKSEGTFRGWEYARVGDYHRELDRSLWWAPAYLRRISYARTILDGLPRKAKVLDAGCGEGVLVEEFCRKGLDIKGLDVNYESPYVTRGNILGMPYAGDRFDMVLLLDVFEHLSFSEQPKALEEIQRVLKPKGKFLVSIPNQAHLNSRIRFLFLGRLDRTDIETNHVGERPIWENEKQLLNGGFRILKKEGCTLSLPLIYKNINAARHLWLHNFLNLISPITLKVYIIYLCQTER